MGRQIGNASNRIALHFNIWRHHLSDKRGQSTKTDNSDLVFRYDSLETVNWTPAVKTYCLLQDFQVQHWQHVELQYQGSVKEREWAPTFPDQLPGHLGRMSITKSTGT